MYLAHISKDKKREQPLIEHLENVAKLAGKFAESFNCYDWGYGCGYLHDCGKGSKEFLNRLNGGKKVDHSTAGAKELIKRNNFLVAYCVAGHHSGLLNGGHSTDGQGDKTLYGRMSKVLCDYQEFLGQIQFPEFPDLSLIAFEKGGFSASFFIRMLFSCLVDADYLDTESFMINKILPRGNYDSIEYLHSKLGNYIKDFMKEDNYESLNGVRTDVLKSCLKMGERDRGIFRLSVPTGGGKTISSLAFALEHAKKHKLKRVIFAIPYCSIIDQTAEEYRKILGCENVLEDHSNVYYENEEELHPMQLASENWDMPIVVTTNINLFTSLFANKSTKCRKLHNISNSVIVFDEAQMIPTGYIDPCIHAINELVYNYNCTAVLCTATQPALDQFFQIIWNKSKDSTTDLSFQINEIYPEVNKIYQYLKRTNFSFIGKVLENDLIEMIKEKKQVLCIVNSRRRAQNFFYKINRPNTFHLSSVMYAENRKLILNKIKSLLKNGEACCLISTSVVECGMDLDFEFVYKELAGLDSIIQAAGRCNREGKKPLHMSNTIIFEQGTYPDMNISEDLKRKINVTQEIISEFSDIGSPDAVNAYFHRLFHLESNGGTDSEDIVCLLDDSELTALPFESISKKFKFLEQTTFPIFITKEKAAKDLLCELKKNEYSKKLLREINKYCVNIYFNDYQLYTKENLLEKLENDLFVLLDNEKYSMEEGLQLNFNSM